MFTKLNPIKMPDTENVNRLWRDTATSHGIDESIDPTDAPNPKSTSKEGSAQQSNVLSEVNKEK
jgi:hypothetical protein